MTGGLVLGGTYEARILADALAQRGILATLSLAGATQSPAQQALPTRIGGFGGAVGFAQYLHDHAVRWVVDATHPFADQMTKTASTVCLQSHCPYLRLQRPAWQPSAADQWHLLDDLDHLGRIIPQSAVIFAATGRQTAPAYAKLKNRIYLRVIDPPRGNNPMANIHYVQGRPPFSVDDEVKNLSALGIDWLVVKNAGGAGGRAKLDAAAQLGLPVALLNRPAPPQAQCVEQIDAAIDWIVGHG